MDTLLYDMSIPAISSLQTQLSDQAPFMQLMSVVFDPKYAFLIYSPLAYLIDNKIGKKLIMTTVLAEWLNMILKWLLHGERPYWYVHSSGHFDAKQTPIQQFPITCELGPGHPSGHAMVTAAVWYIILDSALQVYNQHRPQRTQQTQLGVWASYLALLVSVSVSRVFLGCHFPHQCMAGALLGYCVARWVSSVETKAWHYVGAAFVLLASAFGTFALLQALGFDPSWTIKLATKHCEKREYIHLDTAPFFSIMRYCGFALGTGLGLMAPFKRLSQHMTPSTTATPEVDAESKSQMSSRNLSWLSAKILMAMLMARLVDNMGLFVSHNNLTVFYTAAFAAYTMFSFAFVSL